MLVFMTLLLILFELRRSGRAKVTPAPASASTELPLSSSQMYSAIVQLQ
jgi:hypothetical protein